MAFLPADFKSAMFLPISSWEHKWYAIWDLNPENTLFESVLYASSSNGAYKVPFH